MSSPIRLVCFDLGGVIVRTCSSWEQACERAGLAALEAVDDPQVEAGIRAADARHEIGAISDEEFYREIAAVTGGIYRPEEIARIHGAWLLGEFPGLEEIVAGLNANRGIRTACLSNTNHRHWELMLGDGADPDAGTLFPAFHRLSLRFASHLLGKAKPTAEAYLAFEERTGSRGPEILFFDDRADNVQAAREAGWISERIAPPGDPASQIRQCLRLYRLLDPAA